MIGGDLLDNIFDPDHFDSCKYNKGHKSSRKTPIVLTGVGS